MTNTICTHCGGSGGAIGSGYEDVISGEPCHAGPYFPVFGEYHIPADVLKEKGFNFVEGNEHGMSAEELKKNGWTFLGYDEYGEQEWLPPQD